MDEDYEVLDLARILIGDLPWGFLLEVVLRVTIMYFAALLVVRMIGKRSMSQVSPFDFIIIIALGSAVGDPMLYDNVPLLPGIVVLLTVLLLERSMAHLVTRSNKIEHFVEGVPRCLVESGVITTVMRERDMISREELFSALRLRGVRHLGQVDRAYIENSGQISVYCFEAGQERYGLPISTPWKIHHPQTLSHGEQAQRSGAYACMSCGNTLEFEEGAIISPCPNCRGKHWTPAVS